MNFMTAYPALGSVYAPNGVPKKEGEIISQPDLAATLQAVADGGVTEASGHHMKKILTLHQAIAFYNGTIAQNIVKDINAAGGNYSLNDLQNYYTKGVTVGHNNNHLHPLYLLTTQH